MPHPDFLRTTGFRWGIAVAGILAVMVTLLLVFVYWQCTTALLSPLDNALADTATELAPDSTQQILSNFADHTDYDPRRVKLRGLFDAAGERIGGNLAAVPPRLTPNGVPHTVLAVRSDARGRDTETIRAVARRLADGRILVIGRNIDELLGFLRRIERILVLALVPAMALSIVGGTLAGLRAQRRLTILRRSAARIMAGHLTERLPARAVGDDLDQLVHIVNQMLDELETLVRDIKGVGDDIAHDLRTPLTWVRARLERGREHATSLGELGVAVDEAVAGIDQALDVVVALLRIAEIEHGRRYSGFGQMDLGEIVREVGELYAPIAEDRGLGLELHTASVPAVAGDRDLLFEAVANLVDNAMKFTPSGEKVQLRVEASERGPVIRVADTGPGIPPQERENVFRRFYRSDKSRHTSGVGLGLNLVAAVVNLHGFALTLKDNAPGCVVEIGCWPQHGMAHHLYRTDAATLNQPGYPARTEPSLIDAAES
jgi:signal transduction histidine kinase